MSIIIIVGFLSQLHGISNQIDEDKRMTMFLLRPSRYKITRFPSRDRGSVKSAPKEEHISTYATTDLVFGGCKMDSFWRMQTGHGRRNDFCKILGPPWKSRWRLVVYVMTWSSKRGDVVL